MRKSLAALLLLAAALTPASAPAQTARVEVYPLFTDYDLDVPGEGTDADQILEVVDLEADTDFTLDSLDPGDCREVTITVVDTTPSIDTGTVTVTGADCEGNTIVWVAPVSGGAGTYNSLDPAESGREDYYFSSVATVVSSADLATLGGSSDETITVGVLADTSQFLSCVTYGGSIGDPLTVQGSWIAGNARVETSGASNTVTGVSAAADAFLNVDAGDEIIIRNLDSGINGAAGELRRVVVTNADDDTITVNDPDLDLDDRAEGYPYIWRDRVCSQSTEEGWVPVAGATYVQALVNVQVLDVDSEDGLFLRLQCKNDGADPIIYVVDTTDVTAAGVHDLTSTEPYEYCRVVMLLDSFDSSIDTGLEAENLDGVMHVFYAH